MANIKEAIRQAGQHLEKNKKAVMLSGILTAGTAVGLTGCGLGETKTEATTQGQGTSQSTNNDNKLSAQATITAKELEDLKKQIVNGAKILSSESPKASLKPAETIGASQSITETVFLPKEPQIVAAKKDGDKWLLQHPDQGGKTVVTALPEGFIPDKDLHMATDIKSFDVGDVNQYKDWEKALNTGRPVGDRLTGYNYDYNDFCNNVLPKFTCTAQGDMYAWRIFQGEKVVVPGIGELTGGPRRSVVVIVLNLDGSIHAWDPENPVQVKHGFTATGRIFDGDKAAKTEQGLLGHWLSRQFNGTPEKSYIGVTDDPNNAKETLFVTVQRKQWGLNADGSKRMEFQLIRAGIAQAGQPGPAGK